MYCDILPPFYRSTNIHICITHTTPLKDVTEALILKKLSVPLPTSINMVVSVTTACSHSITKRVQKRKNHTQERNERI